MNINADNPNDVKLFEDFKDMREGNNFGALTVLRNNVIQGSNTTGENHLGTETDQTHIMVGGKLPEGGHTYGGATYGSGNAIQESDSSSKNFLGSRLTQKDITYNVKDVPED
ncbi:Similar to cc_bv7.4_22.5 [Cotesia congregata]|uniref:Similar to cc_bv7.4_22.5 n=1 Tax=Cotesia congregata TaxID=51543 RepID=A0A8J2HDF3_COTCN|nr:Similar to cc_bv7.4_22.5 [Cotesia congregata]